MEAIFGIVGLCLISWAVWFRNERRQDLWFILGGVCLLVYSVAIGSVIFTVLQLVFIVSAALELARIGRKKKI